MFGFSLAKIALTVLAAVAAWRSVRWWTRLQAARGSHVASHVPDPLAPSSRRPAARGAIEDMVACPACGTFVARRGGRSCERRDCPFPA